MEKEFTELKEHENQYKSRIEELRPNEAATEKGQESSRLKQMKDINSKFASSTSVYGLVRATKATSRPLQLAWLLMTAVSLSAGVYVITLSMQEYLQYDVFTQTKRRLEASSLLPAVTFCTDAAAPANLSELFVEALFVREPSNVSLSGETFRPSIHLDEPYRCVRFNHHNAAGANLLYATDSEFFMFNISLNDNYTFIDAYLSDNYVHVLSTSDFVSGFRHAPDELYIEFTKSIETKLEEPYNECQAMADRTYRQVNCLFRCQEERAAAKYNCSLRTFFSRPGLAICDESQVDWSELASECASSPARCPKECDETKFESVVSSYDSTHLTVQVAFLDLSYIEISQTPKMTVVSLLSNIGGALGLFVGVRFLSLLELFEYLSELVCVFHRNPSS